MPKSTKLFAGRDAQKIALPALENSLAVNHTQDTAKLATIAPNIEAWITSTGTLTPELLSGATTNKEKADALAELAEKTPVELLIKHDLGGLEERFKILKKDEAEKLQQKTKPVDESKTDPSVLQFIGSLKTELLQLGYSIISSADEEKSSIKE